MMHEQLLIGILNRLHNSINHEATHMRLQQQHVNSFQAVRNDMLGYTYIYITVHDYTL
jgi:hypothetical protein